LFAIKILKWGGGFHKRGRNGSAVSYRARRHTQRVEKEDAIGIIERCGWKEEEEEGENQGSECSCRVQGTEAQLRSCRQQARHTHRAKPSSLESHWRRKT
jgi:hypothetical protein